MTSSATRVIGDATKNRRSDTAALILGPGAIATFVYGLVAGWGFFGMMWIGLLAILMSVYLFGRLFGKGGFAAAPCPGCGVQMRFTNPERARTLQCEACGAWSTGREEMAPITDDHIAPTPVFPTPLPEDGSLRWPALDGGAAMCADCCGEAHETFTIEGNDGLGQVAAMASPVSVRRIHTLEVPTCGAHGKEGAALQVVGREATLLVKSWPFHRALAASNSEGGPLSG